MWWPRARGKIKGSATQWSMRARNSEQAAPLLHPRLPHVPLYPPHHQGHHHVSQSQPTHLLRNTSRIDWMGTTQARTPTVTLCLAMWPNNWMFDSSVQFLCPMARASFSEYFPHLLEKLIRTYPVFNRACPGDTWGHGSSLPEGKGLGILICSCPALLFGDWEAALGRWWQFHTQAGFWRQSPHPGVMMAAVSPVLMDLLD